MLVRAPPACWLAFIALGERDDVSSMRLLADELASSDLHRRRAAVEALGHHGEGARELASIRLLLSDPSPVVVRSAIQTLVRLKDDDSHGRLVGLLRDPDPATRCSAVDGIDQLWVDGDEANLIELAENDAAVQVRRRASAVLFGHANQLMWRRMVDLWRRSDLPRERVWACRLFARFGSAADRASLLPFMGDGDGHVRKAATRTLAVLAQRDRSY
jgi:HEAT repeat protein